MYMPLYRHVRRGVCWIRAEGLSAALGAGLKPAVPSAVLLNIQEANDVVLVQEYAEGGDLYRLLHKNGGRLAERQAVEMVLQPFLLALHYLHTRGIMHRDIKVRCAA